MAGRTLETVLQPIRKLAAAQAAQALPDRALLDRFSAEHDEAAFAALLERHGAMVLGICRRVLRNGHDAEDASQATFLVLARKAATIQKKESVASWLHGVAFHVATNLKRDLARRSARETPLLESAGADGASEASWREVQAMLDEELARLPEHYRCPLILCYLEGKTRDEAAAVLGWGLATLRGRLERGRERLRARLNRRGLTLSAALFAHALTESSASAALPAALVALTVKAALLRGANVGGAGGVSARVAALTEGALTTLSSGKAKGALAILGVVLAAGIGLGLLTLDKPGSEQTEATTRPLADLPRGRSDEPKRLAAPLPARIQGSEAKRAGRPDEQEEAGPREPQRVPQRFLDLQPHANQKLKEGFGRPGNDLAGLPPGEQTLAGVKFNIGEGLILLTGRGKPGATKVEGIKVGTRFSRLAILHATQFQTEKGVRVGYYTVHYEDLTQETIPIVYGKDVSDWWYKACQGPSRAEVAWKGTNEDATRTSGATLRLYLARWHNPQPARKVVSIDFASTNANVAPFCVAMTTEE